MTHDLRIARVQKTLRWLEEDRALLDLRVKELSRERQESAKRFAAAVILETRAELHRLLQQRPYEPEPSLDPPCEPAD
jgi:hypothetical protein